MYNLNTLKTIDTVQNYLTIKKNQASFIHKLYTFSRV